jgi:thermitase
MPFSIGVMAASFLPLMTSGLSDDWALRAVNAYEAWDMFTATSAVPGAGVIVAHIDTGISKHPELAGANILWEKSYNFVDNNKNIFHRFSRGQFPAHGHGTETLSVMASPAGCPEGQQPSPCVTGIAPGATYLPLLVSDSAIIGSGETVARGINYAIDAGAQVINISLGNVISMPLVEKALNRAREEGVIVIAAAGNSTGTVKVYPGAYNAAIAIGGTTSDASPWANSSVGAHVAWSAPASEVYAAFVEKINGAFAYSVKLAAGTSDAAAITTGIAALWISYHGRDNLIAHYGKSGIVPAFKKMVMENGVVTASDWPQNTYGSGIINAQKVLENSL